MPAVDLICLASSRKYRGRCIAGVRLDGSGWVRPVSSDPFGTLQPQHFRLAGGTDPQLLDVLRVDLAEHRPDLNQPENWLLGPKRWELVERPAKEGASALLTARVTSGPLFGTAGDRLTREEYTARPSSESLTLVRPGNLVWQVRRTQQGHPQVRAQFDLGASRYNLTLTDMVWEPFIASLGEGYYRPHQVGMPSEERLLFTISLGEPTDFDAAAYKLVAAILAWPESWARLTPP